MPASNLLKTSLSIGIAGSVVVLLTVVINVWGQLSTDVERELLHKELTGEHIQIVEKHDTDIDKLTQAARYQRIGALDKEIREIDENLRFGKLTEEEAAYKNRVRGDLTQFKQDIIDGKR